MRPTRTILLVALALPLPLPLPVAARAQGAADSVAAVDSVFARYASREAPGCAVAVGRDGRTVVERAYGMANLEYDVPNTPATIFEAGSVSKQFTAAALVLLALDGRLSLDDPARKYVPELPDYGAAPLTIRHMLNHTSGLRDWGSVAAIAGWPRGTRVHSHAHVLDIVRRQRSLNFPVNSEHDYSNTGYNLGAIIVERVSGEPFAELTRRRIFEPLGMRHTSWRDDFTRTVKGRSTAYSPRGRDSAGFRLDMPFENVHGQGGLLTTVGDLLRWNEHLARPADAAGGRAFADSMHRRGRLTSGREIEYALGLYLREYAGQREVGHSGSTAGYRAYLARYPEHRLSVALLCNRGDANPTTLARRVASVFLPRPASVRPAFAGFDWDEAPRADLAAVAGVYRHSLTREPLRLALGASPARLQLDRGGGRGPTLFPTSPTTFVTTDTLSPTTLLFQRGDARRPDALRVVAQEGDTVLYTRALPAPAPDALRPAQFAGTYHSAEAEVTYIVTADSAGRGGLVIRRRPDVRFALTPVYADAFTAPGLGLVAFTRDATGRVTGLTLGTDRVRELRFERTPPR